MMRTRHVHRVLILAHRQGNALNIIEGIPKAVFTSVYIQGSHCLPADRSARRSASQFGCAGGY
jgi:hypothetical protein